MNESKPWALIVGAGGVLGEACAKTFRDEGLAVIGLRRPAHADTAAPAGGPLSLDETLACDLTDMTSVSDVVHQAIERRGAPALMLHNAATLLHAPLDETSNEDFERCWRVAAASAFASSRVAAPAMVAAGGGFIGFIGATASCRGSARFPAFAAAKFALRGLAQSLARELQPRGVHVAHLIVDGVLRDSPTSAHWAVGRETIDSATVARLLMSLVQQPRDAWTHELDVRPATGSF